MRRALLAANRLESLPLLLSAERRQIELTGGAFRGSEAVKGSSPVSIS